MVQGRSMDAWRGNAPGTGVVRRSPPEARARVVFVTTQFESTPTGPSVYAQYLWEGFQNDSEVEFHLVAPTFPNEHERLHASGACLGSLELYDRLCRTAIAVADRLGEGVIVHANNSHMGRRLLAIRHTLWGQVNDYQNTDAYRDLPRILRRTGPRRALALIRRRWLERQFVHRQDLTICNSRYTRQRVLEAYRPAHPERAVVISKAVDLGFFRRPATLPPDPAQRDPSHFRIIIVGSDFVVKGLDLLIEACLGLEEPVHLCAVGVEEAAFARRFPGLATRLRASRLKYTFAGRQPREQVRALLWNSDLFAMPTRSEALGVAILEALAAGLPVVATRVGGVPEILEGQAGSELIEAGDVAALAQSIAGCRRARTPDGAMSLARLVGRFDHATMLADLRARYVAAGVEAVHLGSSPSSQVASLVGAKS